jgi:hypothetical protein
MRAEARHWQPMLAALPPSGSRGGATPKPRGCSTSDSATAACDSPTPATWYESRLPRSVPLPASLESDGSADAVHAIQLSTQMHIRTWCVLRGSASGLRPHTLIRALPLQIPEIPTAFVGYRHAGAWVHITSEALGRKGAARLISGDPAAAPRLELLHHVH